MSHIPVLFDEVIGVLRPQKGEFFVDGTAGSGGHAEALARAIAPAGALLSVDWDPEALRRTGERLKGIPLTKLVLHHGNYADLAEILAAQGFPRADGLLLDLGFSSEQLAHSGRGFSFSGDEPLDMRYDPEGGGASAAEVVNTLSRERLADILSRYGEERRARKIAEAIAEMRRVRRILRTGDLVAAIEAAGARRGKLHAATKVFMALRIFVNRELENLAQAIEGLEEIMAPHGRVAVISFHSLEDRLVKFRFRELVQRGKAEFIVKKPIAPSRAEIERNPRSRSAKLRAIRMKAN